MTRAIRKQRARPPAIEIMIEAAQWKGKRNTKALLLRAIAAAAAAVPTRGGEVAIVLTDDKAIRVLNRDWRQKNAPTNVLSFPAKEARAALASEASGQRGNSKSARAGHSPEAGSSARAALASEASGQRGNSKSAGGAPRLLGDIVIAYETTEREARAERKPFAHHLTHLAVHGFLHLVGYDHVADDEAQAMEGLETSILARLGVPDPYIVR
jgi:probable rRNA maturation factor